MRGEWAEFNPWQIPMGRATAPTLEAMGVKVMRVENAADVIDTVAAAATLAFEAEERVAVLLSQRLLGAKKW
jgi:sulfopyruvate decarboxylase TPP-binding subunit